jgi:hypothetical protein
MLKTVSVNNIKTVIFPRCFVDLNLVKIDVKLKLLITNVAFIRFNRPRNMSVPFTETISVVRYEG